MFTSRLNVSYVALGEFCQRNRIQHLALFGSVLRDDFNADSDIDVLVQYEPGAQLGYLDMAAQELELSQLFGRKVDLREQEEISGDFRQRVLNSAVTIYERR